MQRRLTKQKELILDIVQRSYDHPTADEVYAEAKSIKDDISRCTVYRNLHQLAEDGLIQEITSIGQFPNRYDFNLKQHYHVVCSHCGKIEDVDVDLNPLDISKVESTGFKVTGVEIIFRGVCPKCRKKEN